MEKKFTQISNLRLINQKLKSTEFTSAREIVSWMGAMQAQDFNMSKWAVGIRQRRTTEKKVDDALDKGEILRTHLLRPTWHLVAAEDVYWMTKLNGSKINSSLKHRQRWLELSEDLLSKSKSILVKNLRDKNYLTRNEIVELFNKAGIRTDENRLSHIMICSELDGTICSGPSKGNKQTYSLLSHRVSVRKELNRDESLAELARRYFTSRCPATLQDFAWWSNLSLTDVRKSVDFIKNDFTLERIEDQQYLFPVSLNKNTRDLKVVHLLPSFDELLISYKDRTSSLSLVHNKKAVSDNGIFYPPLVIGGQVAGLWKRTILKERVMIELDPFEPLDESVLKQVNKKVKDYSDFLGKKADLKFKQNEFAG